MTKTQTANWQVIDASTLDAATANAHAAYKAAYATMKAERDAFETALRAAVPLPAGKRLAISYNFGKLSVAIVADDTKPTSTKGAVSLASLLK